MESIFFSFLLSGELDVTVGTIQLPVLTPLTVLFAFRIALFTPSSAEGCRFTSLWTGEVSVQCV